MGMNGADCMVNSQVLTACALVCQANQVLDGCLILQVVYARRSFGWQIAFGAEIQPSQQ